MFDVNLTINLYYIHLVILAIAVTKLNATDEQCYMEMIKCNSLMSTCSLQIHGHKNEDRSSVCNITNHI